MANYQTKQKTVILNCLQKSGGRHFTVDDLVLLLREQGTAVGKTTVYRYLERLSEDGIVRRYRLDEGMSACYQYVERATDTCTEHFHLKCTECGALIHLDCDHLSELHRHIEEEHDFLIDRARTVFYGRCKKCRRAAEEQEKQL